MDSYLLPRAGKITEYAAEIKRSRFIALVSRSQSEDEARAFIHSVHARFPDARHHCSAYMYQQDGAQPVERSSDDGEPAGTAGKPMLDVLKGSGMWDVCAVVVRYFGGIKLGAGGLVHAYGGTLSEAVAQVPRVTRAQRELYTVEVAHAEAGRLEAELRARGYDVQDTQYGAAVTYTVACVPGARAGLAAVLAALTQGRLEPRTRGRVWVELPGL